MSVPSHALPDSSVDRTPATSPLSETCDPHNLRECDLRLPERWPLVLLRNDFGRRHIIERLIAPAYRSFSHSRMKLHIGKDQMRLDEIKDDLEESMHAHAVNLAISLSMLPPPELRRICLELVTMELKHREGSEVADRFSQSIKLGKVDDETKEAVRYAWRHADGVQLTGNRRRAKVRVAWRKRGCPTDTPRREGMHYTGQKNEAEEEREDLPETIPDGSGHVARASCRKRRSRRRRLRRRSHRKCNSRIVSEASSSERGNDGNDNDASDSVRPNVFESSFCGAREMTADTAPAVPVRTLSYEEKTLFWSYGSSMFGWNCKHTPHPKAGWVLHAEKTWDLDVQEIEPIDLSALISLSEKDCPESAVPLSYIVSNEKFRTLFRRHDPPTYVKSNMDRHVTSLLDSGIWAPMKRRHVKTWISAFTVPKPKKEKLRLIANAIPLNKQQMRIPDYHLHLATLEELENLTLKHDYVGELDGVGWFHQFPIPNEMRKHLAVSVGRNSYSWTRMPMGWHNAVDVAHASLITLQTFPSLGDPLSFVDNALRFGQTAEDVKNDMDTFLERAASIGAKFEVTTQPTQHAEVLGVAIDLRNKTFALTAQFTEKLASLAITSTATTYRKVWQLVGSMIWAMRIHHISLQRLSCTLMWLRRAAQALFKSQNWDGKCVLETDMLHEITSLHKTLCANRPYDLNTRRKINDAWIFCDASTEGWGCVYDNGNLQLQGGVFPEEMKGKHISLKELWAVWRSLKFVPARPITIFTDNTSVLSWLQRGYSNISHVSELLRRIFTIVAHEDLSAIWIPTNINPADAPSRGVFVPPTVESLSVALHMT